MLTFEGPTYIEGNGQTNRPIKTKFMFVLIEETTLFYFKMLLSNNFASLIKAQVDTQEKPVRLRQLDSLYVRNLFHEHLVNRTGSKT